MNENYITYQDDRAVERIFLKANIKPHMIRRLRRFRAILAGGSLLSELFNVGDVGDYDFYFREDYLYKQALSYDGSYGRHGTLHTSTYQYAANKPIQLINIVFGEPTEILDSFDITACQLAYDTYSGNFIFSKQGLEDISNRLIRFNHFKYPLANLARAVKYINKGLCLPISELVKIKIVLSGMKEEEIYHYEQYNHFSYKQYENDIIKLFGRFNFDKPLHEHLIKRLAEKCVDI